MAFLTLLLLLPLVSASSLYLHPAPEHAAPALGASALLAQHLALDRFEPLPASSSQTPLHPGAFVGGGDKAGAVVVIDEAFARDVIPETLPKAAMLRYTHFDPTALLFSLSARAERAYGTIASAAPSYTNAFPAYVDPFSANAAASEFLESLAPLVAFIEEPGADKFGVFALRGLRALDGEARALAAQTVRATLMSAMKRGDLQLAVLTAPLKTPASESAIAKRADAAPKIAQSLASAFPVVSDATCFGTADACTNATAGCAGHGACAAGMRAGKTCFVCRCAASRDEKGHTTRWAGAACEREDVSSQFVLLAGTTVGLLAVVSAAVGLLLGMGADALPGVLTSGAGAKRD